MQRQRETAMAIQRFYWLIDGALAGCSRPGGIHVGADSSYSYGERRGWGRPDRSPGALPDATEAPAVATTLDADLDWLRAQGIGAVLSLTETPLPAEALARHTLDTLHIPIDDMTAPTPEQFDRALGFIDRERGLGRAVAVHCKMGQGRTGVILAAYLIRAGVTPAAALRELRIICPGAVGSPEQERALYAFTTRRDWIV
ncbi:MAG: dual specificity protein phosphatase family protein [Ktedonobacterales bacterium]